MGAPRAQVDLNACSSGLFKKKFCLWEKEETQAGGMGGGGVVAVPVLGHHSPRVSSAQALAAEEMSDSHVGSWIGRQHDFARSQVGK